MKFFSLDVEQQIYLRALCLQTALISHFGDTSVTLNLIQLIIFLHCCQYCTLDDLAVKLFTY